MLTHFKIYEILSPLFFQKTSLKLCGNVCLLISHLLWQNKDAQSLFGTEEFAEHLVFLTDFNELVNESDPDASVEALQEISFYALLAMINYCQHCKQNQNLVAKQRAIQTILRQLKSGSYEPKKTACFALANIIKNNLENQTKCIEANAVLTLCEMINDEEDDALSNKAYECLELLGTEVVKKLITELQAVFEDRKPNMWKCTKTIILDIF